MLEFDPCDVETFRDPYPAYRRLRDEVPVYHNESLNFWALARFADVLAAHDDYERFSSAGGVTIEGEEKHSPFLIVKDPPEHRWHRKIIGKVFTPRRIRLAFEEILARWPDFAVDEARAVRKVTSNVRGVAHLPLLTSGAA